MKVKILGRTVVMLFLIAIFTLFLLGCEKDIIENPDYLLADSLYIESGNGGESELVFTFGDMDQSFSDVNVLLVQSDNYSDTVASFEASTHYNYFVVKGLEPETTDIIIYGDDYYPQKYRKYSIPDSVCVFTTQMASICSLRYMPGVVVIIFDDSIGYDEAMDVLDEYELELWHLFTIEHSFYFCITPEKYAFDIPTLAEILILDRRIISVGVDHIYIIQ